MRALHRAGSACVALALALIPFATQTHAAETTFSHGGYVKLDAITTYYHNGTVSPLSALRDFHIPGAIPVGDKDENLYTDFHAKESRLNLQTVTKFDDGREIKGYLEMDFLLSPGGDERVSNSYSPRLRHFYFATGPWLFGQTWMTFMIVVLPDDLDFIGSPEGTTFGRQAQVRYSRNGWQLALENGETTVTPCLGGPRVVTGTAQMPDFVIRRNFKGDKGSVSAAGIVRQLNYRDEGADIDDAEAGFGLSVGAEVNTVGKDDLRVMVTAGRGLGRYLGLNFANAAAVDSTGKMEAIDEVAGFVAYRHFWNDQWRSTVNASFCHADNPIDLTGVKVNRNAQSYSANLLYAPVPAWTIGVEYTYAMRELEDGTDGRYDRVQFSARYSFGYSSSQ